MSEKQPYDGGPAFPFKFQGPTTAPEIYYGMTLRDHFAGLSMQSMMDHYSRNDGLVACDFTEMAKESYLMADAMLAARKGGSDD